jgi:hypothetical protein
MPATPLSVELSRLLVAFTIELDNEFERRMAAALPKPPFRISLVMWSNFLRFVGDGVAVGDLPSATGQPKARVHSTLGGMERWRYVYVAPPPASRPPVTKRDGYGSARALKAEWVVRPTAAGIAAREIWPQLLQEIEERWRSRFGAREVSELRDACQALVDEPLPEYLPIVTGTNGMVSEIAEPRLGSSEPVPLSASLAQVLLSYTLAFEREAPLSLPLTETVVRVVSTEGSDVRELPTLSAVSPEAVSMALTYLVKRGLMDGKKVVRLTKAGAEAAEASRATHGRVERAWTERYGRAALDRLRSAARAVLEQRDGKRCRLALGLEPHETGWRASGRYRAQTDAMLADPLTGLPRHPLVLHRGGWPDGS